MANLEHVEIVKQGSEAIRQWREENPGVRLDLSGADLREANLRMADLREADVRMTSLDLANLYQALLRGANLRGAFLNEANLNGADLRRADLAGAWLVNANLLRANLDSVQGAEHVHYLETARFLPGEGIQAVGSGNDALNFEECQRPWPERWLDWERLRVMGSLPLFGISYTALIFLPIVFYGLALYNDKIDLLRAWAEQAIIVPDHLPHRLAPIVLDRLHPRPIPSLSFLLLVSTVLLAVGSTLYTFFCPSRIKEFSRDQWCDQLGHSLLHYWPFAWKEIYVRLICAACYALGGAGAAWVLGTKVWDTAVFILKHSAWPWPWR